MTHLSMSVINQLFSQFVIIKILNEMHTLFTFDQKLILSFIILYMTCYEPL